jgi:hypothetical protein
MDGLDLKAANGTDLPYEGWVELTFNLIEDDFDHSVKVPFLIAKDFLDMPIVGFNVIEEITKHFESRKDRCLCEPFVTTGACTGSSSRGA